MSSAQLQGRANEPLLEVATDKVLNLLASQDKVLADLARNSDAALAPLASERKSVQGFVEHAANLATATAEKQSAFRAQFEKLPTFLRELRHLAGARLLQRRRVLPHPGVHRPHPTPGRGELAPVRRLRGHPHGDDLRCAGLPPPRRARRLPRGGAGAVAELVHQHPSRPRVTFYDAGNSCGERRVVEAPGGGCSPGARGLPSRTRRRCRPVANSGVTTPDL